MYRGEITMSDEKKKLNQEELNKVAGGNEEDAYPVQDNNEQPKDQNIWFKPLDESGNSN